MKKHAFLAILSIIPSVSWAEEVNTEKAWQSEAELGYVQTGGNTQVRTLNTKLKIITDNESLRTTTQGSALNTSDTNSTVAERYTASLQADWKLSEYDYALGRLAFDTDRFGGFQRRISETVGYGRTLIKDETIDWNIELGAGMRQTSLTSNKKTNESIARASTSIKWHISQDTSFTQTLKAESGKEGTVSNSMTALQSTISGHLSSKISFEVQNTSKVPAGTKNTNTEVSIALVWQY